MSITRKNKILNMEAHMEAGEELDALMAEKVMGWERGKSIGKDVWCKGRNVICYFHAWKPSTSILSAWEVVQKLAVEPFAWHIESLNLTNGRVVWWACYWGDGKAGEILDYSADAPTAPLAICRTALLAVMEAQDDKG